MTIFGASVSKTGSQDRCDLRERVLASADPAGDQPSEQGRIAYRRATERWENEGGATLALLANPIIGTLPDAETLAAISETTTGALPQTGHEQAPAAPAAERFTVERIRAVHNWTPSLLSFRTSRAAGFRFTPGHYARLGLNSADHNAVWRPFSIVSGVHDPHLEFLAMLVPGGDFSGALSRVREGDPIRVDKTSYGFMTIDSFAPGKDLWLLASGTGLGPFLSILRDPASWQIYDKLVLVHSVRHARELAYRDEIAAIPHEHLLAASPTQMRYVPVVTREPWPGALAARIPQLIEDGRLEQAAGVKLDLERSRIMVCGNPDMTRELRGQLTARGFRINRRATPGQLAFENYWQSKPS
jgi:ferredoxin--NADP+ reductase